MMVAHDLDPLPNPQGEVAPVAPPPRRARVLPAIAVVVAVLIGGVVGGVATSRLLDRGQPAGATATATTTTTAPLASAARAGSAAPSIQSVYIQDAPSVVTISTEVLGRFGRSGTGTGSGIVLDTRGDIATNAHVIAGAQQISVTFNDGRTVAATVVGSDSAQDLAVLRVSVSASTLHPIAIGNSNTVQVGDQVYAIGAPFGLSGTLTEGVVSGLHRSNPGSNAAVGNLIQTDAAINPGNSGGALLNVQGQLIGITESITSPVDGNVGVGFAIPVNQLEQALAALEGGGQ
ncbi:MAG TPA: trypsin-like peptidase domain-containing protein [Candidatus Limnocylindrales bacterium]|nr:trypsin-like peptidase domain-containing protein [Candidatus Limnocylindrales bacterium]